MEAPPITAAWACVSWCYQRPAAYPEPPHVCPECASPDDDDEDDPTLDDEGGDEGDDEPFDADQLRRHARHLFEAG